MKYVINLYAGRVYCGNGIFENIEKCKMFFESDEFATRAKIRNTETNETITLKKERATA